MLSGSSVRKLTPRHKRLRLLEQSKPLAQSILKAHLVGSWTKSRDSSSAQLLGVMRTEKNMSNSEKNRTEALAAIVPALEVYIRLFIIRMGPELRASMPGVPVGAQLLLQALKRSPSIEDFTHDELRLLEGFLVVLLDDIVCLKKEAAARLELINLMTQELRKM